MMRNIVLHVKFDKLLEECKIVSHDEFCYINLDKLIYITKDNNITNILPHIEFLRERIGDIDSSGIADFIYNPKRYDDIATNTWLWIRINWDLNFILNEKYGAVATEFKMRFI